MKIDKSLYIYTGNGRWYPKKLLKDCREKIREIMINHKFDTSKYIIVPPDAKQILIMKLKKRIIRNV